MGSHLYKWLMVFPALAMLGFSNVHPVYISVTEIEENAANRSLEISCKIFTDDLEKTLRSKYNKHVDLINPRDKKGMDSLVNDYITHHLLIKVNGKVQALQYLGYEQIDEATYNYFEIKNVPGIREIEVANKLLYDFERKQVNILHITANGKRQSTKLNYPDELFNARF